MALSRKMMTAIRLNLSFSMGLHFLAIVLTITDVLDPVSGVLGHNAGAALMILNSTLRLRWKKDGAFLNEKIPRGLAAGYFYGTS